MKGSSQILLPPYLNNRSKLKKRLTNSREINMNMAFETDHNRVTLYCMYTCTLFAVDLECLKN